MKTLLTPSHSIGPSVEGSIVGFSPGIIGTAWGEGGVIK